MDTGDIFWGNDIPGRERYFPAQSWDTNKPPMDDVGEQRGERLFAAIAFNQLFGDGLRGG